MKKKKSISNFWQIIRESCIGFVECKMLKLSASLAYYTVFSLAPLLIVILYLCGIFFGKEAIEGSIYKEIEGFVGHDSAIQLQDMIRNASLAGRSHLAATIGVIVLIIGATTIFGEIQDSINQIWELKTKPGKSLAQYIKTRLLSFGIIVSLGFLMLVSLGVSTIIEGLSNRLHIYFPAITVVFMYIINLILSFIVISSLFAVIFKVLPDAIIKWSDVLSGAIATALCSENSGSLFISQKHT